VPAANQAFAIAQEVLAEEPAALSEAMAPVGHFVQSLSPASL